jgi:hypothetical protein
MRMAARGCWLAHGVCMKASQPATPAKAEQIALTEYGCSAERLAIFDASAWGSTGCWSAHGAREAAPGDLTRRPRAARKGWSDRTHLECGAPRDLLPVSLGLRVD